MQKDTRSDIITIILRFLVPAYDLAWNIIHYPKLIYKKSFIAEIFYRYIPLTFFFVWLFSLIPSYGSVIYILIMVYGAYSIFRIRRGKDGYNDALFYFILLSFGFLGLRSFVGHTLLADSVARSIGWETGSMFQTELAFYHLGVAISALIYIWIRSRDLLLVLIVTKCVFLLGAMGVHLFEAFARNNLNSGNIGFSIIYGDLVLPIIAIYLYKKSA